MAQWHKATIPALRRKKQEVVSHEGNSCIAWTVGDSVLEQQKVNN